MEHLLNVFRPLELDVIIRNITELTEHNSDLFRSLRADVRHLPSGFIKTLQYIIETFAKKHNIKIYDLSETLKNYRSYKYRRYNEGDYVLRHNDLRPNFDEKNSQRKLTVIVGTADNFTGGELVVYKHDGQQKIQVRKGDVVIIPSHIDHEVLPVQSGTRDILVVLIPGPLENTI